MSKVKLAKTTLILVFITLFSILISISCKDIVFNNPLDPNASKESVKVIRVIETAVAGTGDIDFDSEKFWKSSPSAELIAFDRESGQIIRSFYTTPATGIAFFQDKIYLGHGEQENILYVLDPLSGDVLDKLSTSDLYPGFLTVFGDRLVVYDLRSSGLFEYDPESGDSLRLFELSGLKIGGIAAYKEGLLISDRNTDVIYRVALDGSINEVYTSPVSGIGGIAVDNENYVYLFMLDGKIYKVSLP